MRNACPPLNRLIPIIRQRSTLQTRDDAICYRAREQDSEERVCCEAIEARSEETKVEAKNGKLGECDAEKIGQCKDQLDLEEVL